MEFLHQLLGKDLARLNLSGFFSGTKDWQTPNKELVSNALSQRRLRPDNGEVNSLFLGCPEQPLNLSRVNIKVMGNLSRAGVARSSVNLFDPFALGELPDKGMLPPPAPNN